MQKVQCGKWCLAATSFDQVTSGPRATAAPCHLNPLSPFISLLTVHPFQRNALCDRVRPPRSQMTQESDFNTRSHTNSLCTCKGQEREVVQNKVKPGSNLFRSSDLGGSTHEHEPPRASTAPCAITNIMNPLSPLRSLQTVHPSILPLSKNSLFYRGRPL